LFVVFLVSFFLDYTNEPPRRSKKQEKWCKKNSSVPRARRPAKYKEYKQSVWLRRGFFFVIYDTTQRNRKRTMDNVNVEDILGRQKVLISNKISAEDATLLAEHFELPSGIVQDAWRNGSSPGLSLIQKLSEKLVSVQSLYEAAESYGINALTQEIEQQLGYSRPATPPVALQPVVQPVVVDDPSVVVGDQSFKIAWPILLLTDLSEEHTCGLLRAICESKTLVAEGCTAQDMWDEWVEANWTVGTLSNYALCQRAYAVPAYLQDIFE
jgi:hypothetical protein